MTVVRVGAGIQSIIVRCDVTTVVVVVMGGACVVRAAGQHGGAGKMGRVNSPVSPLLRLASIGLIQLCVCTQSSVSLRDEKVVDEWPRDLHVFMSVFAKRRVFRIAWSLPYSEQTPCVRRCSRVPFN